MVLFGRVGIVMLIGTACSAPFVLLLRSLFVPLVFFFFFFLFLLPLIYVDGPILLVPDPVFSGFNYIPPAPRLVFRVLEVEILRRSQHTLLETLNLQILLAISE